MPKVIIEGQEINLTPQQCASDETIKNLLLPFYPAIAASVIKRETVKGEEIIRIAKGVGTKGGVVASLISAPSQAHDALVLAWQLKQEEINGNLTIEQIFQLNQVLETAISQAHQESKQIGKTLSSLRQAAPQPSRNPIPGI